MTGSERRMASAPLWGALLLSAGAWSIHLLVAQFAVEAICTPVAMTTTGGDGGWGVRTILLLLSLGTALVALVGALYALLRRRALERRGPGLVRSAGLAGIISALSFFFVALIVLESVPLLLFACGGT